MLLGEALAERASKKKQLEQVEARAASVARYQEGEQPAENADELLEKPVTRISRSEHETNPRVP